MAITLPRRKWWQIVWKKARNKNYITGNDKRRRGSVVVLIETLKGAFWYLFRDMRDCFFLLFDFSMKNWTFHRGFWHYFQRYKYYLVIYTKNLLHYRGIHLNIDKYFSNLYQVPTWLIRSFLNALLHKLTVNKKLCKFHLTRYLF